ncbi:MAG: DUF1499 domain-containing protein [Pirellulaceae bacterium]
MKKRDIRRWIVRAILFAMIGMGAVMVMNLFSKPPANLGVRGGRLAACPGSPNCVCSHDSDSQHAIAPLNYSTEPGIALQRIVDSVGSLGGKVVERRDGYLRAEFTSRLLRFVDDVEFYFPPDESIIHVRSASRIGYSDLGVNRQRVEQIRRRLEGND